MCARWVSAFVCDWSKALFSTFAWLGVHELSHFHLCGLSQSIRYAYVWCAHVWVFAVAVVVFFLWFALIQLAYNAHTPNAEHTLTKMHVNWRMCGSHLLYSTKCIYYRREKYAVQSCCFFPSLLVVSFVRWLLSKQCCMFKMHAKGNKMLLEWYEFIWFNFDTETMHCNAKTPHTHTHTPCPCGLIPFWSTFILDEWHNKRYDNNITF